MSQLIRGNIVKIVFIITVIIVTFVILMVLYAEYFQPQKEIDTPLGAISFVMDPDIEGKYYGRYHSSVKSKDIKIIIYDASLNKTAIMDNPHHEDKVQIPNGCNMTYYDCNNDDKLDGADRLIIQGGAKGDKVSVVFKPNDEVITSHTLQS